jgi:ABC-type polysaccharide/polyol phosphate export permease
MRARVVWRIAVTTLREFLRSPEAIFWTYGFPFLMAVVLGLAFGGGKPAPVPIAVVEGRTDAGLRAAVERAEGLEVKVMAPSAAHDAHQRNKVAALVSGTASRPHLLYQEGQPEARQAKLLVEAACTPDMVRADGTPVADRGSRYIDWLIPGLIGLNLLGAGLWGIGFNIVNMRTGQLLRRLVVAPMRKSEFLVAFLLSRLVLMLPESIAIALFGVVLFGMPVAGSWLAVLVIALVGGIAFNGLGLLIAARPKTLEGVGGWMNLILLPMWLLGGSFFDNSRFPAWLQPAIQALPLTQCNDALREVMQHGAALTEPAVLAELGGLLAWGVASLALALRMFRWV